METTNLKVKQLIENGYKIFSIGENEIWFTDKFTGKLRCIYRKNTTNELEKLYSEPINPLKPFERLEKLMDWALLKLKMCDSKN